MPGKDDPYGIVVLGFDACFRTFDAIGRLGLGDTAAFGLPLAIAGMFILACFAAVAVLLMIRIIEMHLVIYGGVLLLGFGAISFTRDIPKNYLSYAISAGTQLFMVYVVVGLGKQLADSWPNSVTTDAPPDAILRQVFMLAVSAGVFAALAWAIPKAAASLVNGSVSLGASDAFAPVGAAAAVGGMAGAAGGAVLSNLSGATKGAMQATTAGMSLASEHGTSGVKAALKGLGFAAKATSSEVGSALKAKAGLQPPSVHATDNRGRAVENIGTRAAQNLMQQAQAASEAKAAASGAPARQAPGDQGKAATSLATSLAEQAPQFEGSSNGGTSTGRRLAPPTLPPDAAPSSAVSIRLESEE